MVPGPSGYTPTPVMIWRLVQVPAPGFVRLPARQGRHPLDSGKRGDLPFGVVRTLAVPWLPGATKRPQLAEVELPGCSPALHPGRNRRAKLLIELVGPCCEVARGE